VFDLRNTEGHKAHAQYSSVGRGCRNENLKPWVAGPSDAGTPLHRLEHGRSDEDKVSGRRLGDEGHGRAVFARHIRLKVDAATGGMQGLDKTRKGPLPGLKIADSNMPAWTASR
jgi:hypothetical protein